MSKRGSVWKLMASDILMKLAPLSASLSNKLYFCITSYNRHYYEKLPTGTVKCIEEEVPFEVPQGWVWCRLESLIELISGQDFSPEYYNDKQKGTPYITGASNMNDFNY
jgi:hypothetical protein